MRRCRNIFFAAGVIVLAVIGTSAVHHFQLKAAVNRYLAELKAQGEPLELAQVLPPPVPPEHNAAPQFLQSWTLLATNDAVLVNNPPSAMRGLALGKALVEWAQPDVRCEDATNSWSQIQTALHPSAGALAQWEQIPDAAQFDFHLQYTQRFQMLLPHLAREKKAALRLSQSAVVNLHDGAVEAAGNQIRVIFALVNGTADERIAISQLVRLAIAQIGFAATWELLQAPHLNEAQLARLQAAAAAMNFVPAAANVLPVEREGAETMLAQWRSSRAELAKYFDLTQKARESLGTVEAEEPTIWGKLEQERKIFLWRYWWSYVDELRALQGYQVLRGTLRQTQAEGCFQNALAAQEAALAKLGVSGLRDGITALFSGDTDFHSLFSESIPTMTQFIRKVLRAESSRQMVVTALALKRFQLQHGQYPSQLAELTPDWLAAIPRDPVDGQPLRYRRNADGTFLLYSIGENGRDDGGNPALEPGVEATSFFWENAHALDWVWPQPASAAEVEKYYAELARKKH